jgi:tetratricopeptide (TPR) repeat protein
LNDEYRTKITCRASNVELNLYLDFSKLAVMKRLLYYIFFLLFLLTSSSIKAQDFEKELISWIEKHSKEELKNRLDAIKKKYPNSTVPLFLEAYVEENGDRAIELYKQFVEKYPASKFTDNVLLKLGQYYYAIGSYAAARQYLDNMVDQFPNSPLVPEAKYLAARCLIATGYYVSAEQELKEIIKHYSKSPFKDHAREELASLDELAKQDNNPPRVHDQAANSDLPLESSRGNGKYTIQIGAFQDSNNASRQKEFYSRQGYLTSIETKTVSNNLLYLVWVGEFETEEQAARFGEVFKNLHGVSFHIVRK